MEMGVNSIRTSHNPPAPEFLDLCDRMGILVIDELFDIWKLQKYGKVNGYNIYWDDWHEKDVRNFMLRDRNHPSIIAWSTGNEIPELGNTNFHWVPEKLRELIRQYDTTRPITAGSNDPNAVRNGFEKAIDVYGANYHLNSYDATVKALPRMPLYASETASTVSTRGEYFFPVSWNINEGFYNFQASSYDLYAPGWAYRPDLQFEALDKHPRYAGEYVWTGFDYIGEPTPYNQDQTNALNFKDPEERKKAMEELAKLGNRAPSRSSYFGIIDLCGFPKDRFYIYQARWLPEKPMAHILPHWNWPERVGEITPVHVYTSGDEAELFLNGKSLGVRQKGKPHAYRLVWDEVKYQPGELKVVVKKDGKPWAEAKQVTTGQVAKLEVTADRTEIPADGRDLSYLTIRAVDKDGHTVPRTRLPVDITASGPVDLIGICNGDPTDHTTMKPADPAKASIQVFNGLDQLADQFRRRVPDPVGLRADITRPLDPCGPPLDRPVSHQLHRPKAQLVGRTPGQRHRLLRDLLGPRPHSRHRRNQPHRKRRVPSDPQHHVDIVALGLGEKVGHRGHARPLAHLAIGADPGLAPRHVTKIDIQPTHDREHRRHFLQLAGRMPVGPLHHALGIGFGRIVHQLQCLRVHAHQMEVGKDHRHRPVRAHPVQMHPAQPLVIEKDRVQPPADHRLTLGQGGRIFAQALDHTF